MKNTTDLVTLKINLFKQMNDFINKNGDSLDSIMWTNWIIRNTFEQIAMTIAQDDNLWSSMCVFFGDLTE